MADSESHKSEIRKSMGGKLRPAEDIKPAVGLEANGDVETVATALLRARSEGYNVLLACNGQQQEIERFGDLLDATILKLEERSDTEKPLQRLLEAAFELGYPGLIYHRDPTSAVDYQASEEILRQESDYLIEAQPQPTPSQVHSSVVVAIPAYNEEDSIRDVVRECRDYADEVLVVDDGSDDDTSERAREAEATIVQHAKNRGYGAAVKTALSEGDRMGADHLVLVDGDGQHDPSHIPKLVRKQKEEDAHIVIGSRFIGEDSNDIPPYRRVGLFVVNALTNLYFTLVGGDLRISDTQCGFRAYDERAIQSLAEDYTITDDMDASIDILYHAFHNDFDIVEIETTVDYDLDGASSYNPVYHGAILVRNILLNLERVRPALFPGIPGIISTGLGILLVLWIVSDTVSIDALLPLIAATVLLLGGVSLLISAIVSRSIKIR